MGDRAWAKFQAQMKQKRVQKKTKANTGLGAGEILQRGELTVQRRSEVSGKAQEFSRIAIVAREFVPFADYEDITLPYLPTSGCLKSGDSLFCTTPSPTPECQRHQHLYDILHEVHGIKMRFVID